MAHDLRRRLHDAAAAPRFEVPVDELYGRARRARRRTVVASGAAALVAVAVAVGALLNLVADPGAAPPVITPAPEGPEGPDGSEEADRDDALDEDRAPSSRDPADDAAVDPPGDPTDDSGDVDAPGLLDGVEWVISDLDGLRDQHGDLLWDTEGLPASSAVRDGEGGIVFIDATGLWWLSSDAHEPRFVGEGEFGHLVEVTIAGDDRVVRTTDGGDVVLPGGGQPASELPPPEGGQTPEGDPITAANGLTARVVGPEVERTAEGMIDRVLEPATLTIERDGTVELAIVIGTEEEPLARLHDFDGRRVVLTRFPEEPAMAPESLVALDLDCPDCVEILTTTSPPGVALVGTDVDWDGPLQEPRADLISQDLSGEH